MVYEAYRRVKANKGAAGVDGQSIEQFERDLKGNLYKLWNRMSSGCYFPPPVRMVEIPKPGGKGVRVLGVPAVADRIAQTVAAMVLEPGVEKIFHPDSYGYRPGRSALDAVGACRERCWRTDWVIDLDIRGFFDNLDHDLVLRAVAHHTERRWILLYVRRWLTAPLQRPDGTLVARDRGSPQGSAISPLLANLFMHYAFDAWMAREFPAVAFERYCDDVVVHCRSEADAHRVREAIAQRLEVCGGLQLHPEKTRIVYCRDGTRCGSYEHTSFTFLGYGFRVRKVRTQQGRFFFGFNPAISDEAAKRVRAQIRSWRLHLRSGSSLRTSHARSTPSCGGGSTTTGGTTRRRWSPASTGSMTTWSGGTCRSTSGTTGDGCGPETPWEEPQRFTPGSSPTGNSSSHDRSDRMMGAV
jgi:group II intron reverse transcriptase/maturase